MRQDEIKKAFDSISLSDEKKKQIYSRIRELSGQEEDIRESGSQNAEKQKTVRNQSIGSTSRILKGLATAAAVFLALGITVIGGAYLGMTVSGAAAGESGKLEKLGDITSFSDAGSLLKGLFGLNTDTQEVVQQAGDDIFRNIIYAPDVVWLDEQKLLFATDRALFLYDRENPDMLQTIDLQKTDCIYWNVSAGEIHTHAIYEDGEIWLFNEKNGTRYGRFYHYDLKDADTPSEELEDDKLWAEIYEKWQSEDSRYVDTFHTFEEIGLGIDHIHPNDGMYSMRSLRYTSPDGTDYLAYLTVPAVEKGIPAGKNFILNLYDESTGENFTEQLLLAAQGQPDGQETQSDGTGSDAETTDASTGLPEFVYTGDDPALPPICDYLRQYASKRLYVPADSVFIPGFVVWDQIERDGSLYVFGDFWAHFYYRNGNTLMDASGAAFPARFELKLNASGEYEIVEMRNAADGGMYRESIREFTEGFDGVYEKYFLEQTEAGRMERQEAKKEFIRMYEERYHLGIAYYRQDGWEPVAIYEEE